MDQGYWNEEEWEKHLLENERLMDRYMKVWEENPHRKWEDPVDLYYKVHFGIDFGEELKFQSQFCDSPQDPRENSEDLEDISETSDSARDDLEEIPAYRMAFEFGLSVSEFLKTFEADGAHREILKDLRLHAFKIAADIAGGHGLGYEEETLCGNIVKNRWALGHLETVIQSLRTLATNHPNDTRVKFLLEESCLLSEALRSRITELRAKVWWD